MYKTGTGTLRRVCGDVGRGDVWDARTSNIGDAGGKVGGKCDISFFVRMCYLWSTLDHIGHLMMFTQNISLYRSKRTDYLD